MMGQFKDKNGVLSIFDNFVMNEFIVTEIFDDRYYLDDGVEYKGIKTTTSFIPYFILDNLIKLVEMRCFLYGKYTKFIDGNNFSWMVKNTYNFLKEFNVNIAKNIVNCFIGNLNKKYNHDNQGFITRDIDTVSYALVKNMTLIMMGLETIQSMFVVARIRQD